MKRKTSIISLLCCGLLCLTASLFIFTACDKEDKNATMEITVTQVGEEQNVNVSWTTDFVYDTATVYVIHDGDVNYEKTYNASDISETPLQVPAFYGKHDVKVRLKKGSTTCTREKEVAVFASEYNIAPLTATMPVTMFSLSLPEITNNYTIPTFVWFKRSNAWNYEKMPANVYTVPVATEKQIKGNSDQSVIYRLTNAWIKELYDINPSSHFHLFYNDYFGYGWMDATIARGIPAENYDVSLLSDGTASFYYFNGRLNNENYATVYEEMKREYTDLKAEIAEKGGYVEGGNYSIPAGDMRDYAFVMAKEEPNLKWWLTRASGTLGTATLEDGTVYDKLVAGEVGIKILIKDLKGLYTGLTDENKEMVRTLYDFGNSLFTEAVETNKKPMIILGTWTKDEREWHFEDFVKATMAYYGTEEYVYYYKGHPKNPTNTEPGKLEYLESLGLTDVDSTISAELFFFVYPSCVGTGYKSSTFLSTTDEQTGAIWNLRKDSFGEGYKENVEVYFSYIVKADETYGEYVDGTGAVLIELKDTSTYDFGIYDPDTNEISYYKDGVKAN